ncbi:hypothetical protein R3P38DRAFT_2911055 [Favolaschia claudopus]|uniref:Uncharacterized protein n=1 Tax=Favolaschia claudopus TaxID=2862362 RepID=A0AAW0CEV6_9AGAR
MKLTSSFGLIFLPFIVGVVASPTAPTSDAGLCNWIVNCGGFGACEAGPCIQDGYSCSGAGVPMLAPGGTVNATCTTACHCELFCGVGPVCPP